MSTRIGHGYRLASRCDPFDLLEQLQAPFRPLYTTLWTSAFTAAAVRAHDELLLETGPPAGAGDRPSRVPAVIAARQLADDCEQRGTLDVSVTVLRAQPRSGGDAQCYALLFAHGQQAYIDAFEQLEAVEPWPYWNHVDRPDGISQAVWDHRRLVWDRLLGHHVPAEAGWSWQLLPNGPARAPDGDVGWDRVLTAVADLDTRAHDVATVAARHQADRQLLDAGSSTSDILRTWSSESYRQQVDATAAQLAPQYRDQLPVLDRAALSSSVRLPADRRPSRSI